jgi:hypothetical protein
MPITCLAKSPRRASKPVGGSRPSWPHEAQYRRSRGAPQFLHFVSSLIVWTFLMTRDQARSNICAQLRDTLRHLQRRSQDLHTVFTEQPGEIRPRRNPVKLGGRREKGLHLTGRLESNQHPPGVFTYMRPYVWDTAWWKDRVTTPKFETFSTYLDYVESTNDVEPLVLAMMDVAWRPSLPVVDLFDE